MKVKNTYIVHYSGQTFSILETQNGQFFAQNNGITKAICPRLAEIIIDESKNFKGNFVNKDYSENQKKEEKRRFVDSLLKGQQ